LVDGGDDLPSLRESLQVRDGPVRHSDSFRFACSSPRVSETTRKRASRTKLTLGKHLFHGSPRLCLIPILINSPRTIGVHGEELTALVGNEANRPVDEEEVDRVNAERGEGLVDTFLDVVVVRVPAVLVKESVSNM
jgi:hypothetical protein